jgi:UPF0716 protein FxsA
MRLRLFPALAGLFIGLPLLDTLVLVVLGRYIGFWETIAMVLLSGLLGAGLAKRQGLRVLAQMQRDMAEGRVPAQGLVDAAIILVAGGMLAAPGFITDIVGLALLVPAVRVPIKNSLRRRLETMVVRRYPV